MATRSRDYAELQTDDMLEELEDKIILEYSLALKEVKEKWHKSLKKFKEEDEKQRQKVSNGTLTEEDYNKWRDIHFYTANRYKDLADTLATDLAKVDKKVSSITNEYMPEAYALNFNYSVYDLEQHTQVNTSFTLYSRETVERLLKDDPNLLPKSKVDIPADKVWNRKHIDSAVLQGILQGDSIDSISNRLQQVTDMDRRAAIRNARTMMTGAQNGGRLDAYARAERLGIKIEKEWMATLDSRTRDSHAKLDGERVDWKLPFSNKLMFPGDPEGEPAEVYNCRCTMVPFYPEYADITEKRITYKEWAKAKEEPAQKVIQGKDISETWQRRPELFDFEIEDVINAQGFDGLPRVVSPEEFDEYVKKANGGNGFIAQRAYSAPDQETIEAYREQLYNGKWYVDCSTGGAQYGQGMYCAANYNGQLTEGIIAEMKHYQELNESRMANISFHQEVADARSKDANDAFNKVIANAHLSREEDLLFRAEKLYTASDDEMEKAWAIMANMSKEERSSINKKFNKILSNAEDAKNSINSISIEDYAMKKGLRLFAEPVSYVETITLDPTAKIINYSDLDKMIEREPYKKVLESPEYSDLEKAAIKYYTKYRHTIDNKEDDELFDMLNDIPREERMKLKAFAQSGKFDFEKEMEELENKDRGVVASMLGYDAINAEGHGESGSYTVILNRTKLIIKGE